MAYLFRRNFFFRMLPFFVLNFPVPNVKRQAVSSSFSFSSSFFQRSRPRSISFRVILVKIRVGTWNIPLSESLAMVSMS